MMMSQNQLQNQYGLFDWGYLQDLSRMNPVQRVRGAANDVELNQMMLQQQYGLFDWGYLQNLSRMNPAQRVRGAANDVELNQILQNQNGSFDWDTYLGLNLPPTIFLQRYPSLKE